MVIAALKHIQIMRWRIRLGKRIARTSAIGMVKISGRNRGRKSTWYAVLRAQGSVLRTRYMVLGA